MKLPEFIDAIERLVDRWKPPDSMATPTPRAELTAIYEDVRDQAVKDLADYVQTKDTATRTHGMLITIDRKAKSGV